MALSMPLPGSWANTRKIARHWLYYYDDRVGLLVLSLCIGMTSGRIDLISPNSVVLNRTNGTGGYRSLWRSGYCPLSGFETNLGTDAGG
jgi:hypothetical protein